MEQKVKPLDIINFFFKHYWELAKLSVKIFIYFLGAAIIYGLFFGKMITLKSVAIVFLTVFIIIVIILGFEFLIKGLFYSNKILKKEFNLRVWQIFSLSEKQFDTMKNLLNSSSKEVKS